MVPITVGANVNPGNNMERRAAAQRRGLLPATTYDDLAAAVA